MSQKFKENNMRNFLTIFIIILLMSCQKGQNLDINTDDKTSSNTEIDMNYSSYSWDISLPVFINSDLSGEPIGMTEKSIDIYEIIGDTNIYKIFFNGKYAYVDLSSIDKNFIAKNISKFQKYYLDESDNYSTKGIERIGPKLILSFNNREKIFIDKFGEVSLKIYSLSKILDSNYLIINEGHYEGGLSFLYNINDDSNDSEIFDTISYNRSRTYYISVGSNYVSPSYIIGEINDFKYKQLLKSDFNTSSEGITPQIKWLDDSTVKVSLLNNDNIVDEFIIKKENMWLAEKISEN